jgi:hypothetical protein
MIPPLRRPPPGTARLILSTSSPFVVDAPDPARIREAFTSWVLPYAAEIDLALPDGRVLGASAASEVEMPLDDEGEFYLCFDDHAGHRDLHEPLTREETIALFTRFAAGDAGFLDERDWKPRELEDTIETELRGRIQADARAYGGTLPREAVIGWEGYLAALIEWGTLSVAEHPRLCKLLPRIEDSPVTHILLGREDELGKN